ncbi:MAG: hypothetical protein HYS27_14960 [Deltaproteobacteria bacterium]|nr:hypothetical protein [Deltaproteobacteria bacterium]
MTRLFVAAALVAFGALAAVPAAAVETGDTCKVRAPLTITMKGAAGTIDATIDRGTSVEVLVVGDQGFTRVRAGEMVGSVSTLDLESACSGALRMCRLTAAVTMYEENRSDSKGYLLKPGASLSILKRGKTWAAVRLEDLTGFVKADDLRDRCAAIVDEPAETRGGGEGAVEAVERGDGPGLLLSPFHLEGAAPAGPADALLDLLFDRAAFYRPDAGRVGVEGGRDLAWTAQLAAAAKRARAADMAYALAGRLAVEPPTKDDPLTERYLLQLAVVDAKTGKVLKGARVRPSMRPDDDWPERVLAVLLPPLQAVPGGRPPPSPTQKTDASPALTPAPVAPAPTTPAPADDGPHWFGNLWGYAALGTAAAAGAAAGVTGFFALEQNGAANARVQTDAARPEQRNSALALAITSDALTVTAVSAAFTGVVLFATGLGLGD